MSLYLRTRHSYPADGLLDGFFKRELLEEDYRNKYNIR